MVGCICASVLNDFEVKDLDNLNIQLAQEDLRDASVQTDYGVLTLSLFASVGFYSQSQLGCSYRGDL